MSKTKFTPGPWESETSGRRGALVKGSTGEWVALACGDTDESATANARLITSTPELFAEAEISLEREYNPFEPDNQSARYHRLKALVAKATGARP